MAELSMSIPDYKGSASANSVPKSMTEDAQTSSMINGDEHAPKARKPYTITKQRERWTEEEHKKFIEALQLYGRAWRRIEEFVGTKTAVQIRSHAQKFFSKVVRESKAIEIPPPRPKRKPAHPYPRKMGSLTMGNSCSPTEQENGSPTSVLNPFACENMFYISEFTNPCASPTTSGTGSNEEGTSGMEVDLRISSQVSRKEASVSCIKLFGKTVAVADEVEPVTSDYDDRVAKRSKWWTLLHPKHYGDDMNRMMPLPWWSTYYSNFKFPFMHQLKSSNEVMKSGCPNACIGENVLKNNAVKGFMPYKSCIVKREECESERMNDGGDDKLIELRLYSVEE